MKEGVMIENVKNEVSNSGSIIKEMKEINEMKNDNFKKFVIKSNNNITDVLEKPKLIRSRNII